MPGEPRKSDEEDSGVSHTSIDTEIGMIVGGAGGMVYC
jgi:hypothetical protein